MKAILQRVTTSRVEIMGKVVGEIADGLMLLLGVADGDGVEEADFLAEKTVNLRIFGDENGKMNRSLKDIDGAMLIVSNFTLCADARHGRRPSFTRAATPDTAKSLYERFIAAVRDLGVANVQTGEFGADMHLTIENDGPVTIILDTDEIMKR